MIVLSHKDSVWKLREDDVGRLPQKCPVSKAIEGSDTKDGNRIVVLDDIGDSTPEQFDMELRILCGEKDGVTLADVDNLYRRRDWWEISRYGRLSNASVEVQMRMSENYAVERETKAALEPFHCEQLHELVVRALKLNLQDMQTLDIAAVMLTKQAAITWFRPCIRTCDSGRTSLDYAWGCLCKGPVKGQVVSQEKRYGNWVWDLTDASLCQKDNALGNDPTWKLAGSTSPTVWRDRTAGSWRRHVLQKLEDGLKGVLADAFPGGDRLCTKTVDPYALQLPEEGAPKAGIHLMVLVQSSMS